MIVLKYIVYLGPAEKDILFLAGVHLYLTEKEWINLMNRFHIKSISHYLLFNQEGVMIDFGGHLRPSIPETRAAIERALIQ